MLNSKYIVHNMYIIYMFIYYADNQLGIIKTFIGCFSRIYYYI